MVCYKPTEALSVCYILYHYMQFLCGDDDVTSESG